ncbi:MAG: ribosome silencing factor [Candidatus Aminicenantales bacterium]
MDRGKKLTTRNLSREIKTAVIASQAKKGETICVLDLREISSFTEFFLITHGNSSRQNLAICEGIEQALKKVNRKPLGVEGTAHGEWILMDYGSFVVHIFSRKAREYYSLEKLWGDAPKLSL